MNKTITCLCLFLMYSISMLAQKNITGKVVDTNGVPLISVNVIVKGTTIGTTTDSDGKYFLTAVPSGSTLIFSYIGFIEQEFNVANQKNINVMLREDNKILDEVVVIGYGSMTRKDVTSSITTVKSDQLNVGVYSSPAQLLQGKVPGLTITQNNNPNATPSVTLRGASSLREGAAMEPYYVIDGIPGVSLSTIAPDDIESIDVLRDASATAIYGSKAANGVIIVTTKKGKSGHTNVTYNGYAAFDKVAKNWDMMSGDEYKAYITKNNFPLEAADDLGCNTDWQKEVERTGVSFNHNIGISGGSGKTVYNTSINYLKNQGVIEGTDLERYIGRTYLETKTLKDRLTLSFNLNASIQKSNTVIAAKDGLSVYDAMTYYLPVSPIKNADGSWFENTGRSQYYNPVSLIKENTYFSKTKQLQATAKASLEIVKGLTYDIDLSYQNEQLNYDCYNSSKSMIAIGMNGKAVRSTGENEKKVMEMYFNYDKTFNGLHKLNLMAGYSWEENNDHNGFSATTSSFFNDALSYYNLTMANIIDTNSIGIMLNPNSGETMNYSTLRMISFFGRANYAFNSKYLLQATVRRDGSSAFGNNNRWGTFPSASIAWRASEEPFIKNLGIFDDLKFRAGYGVSGNSMGFDVFTASAVYGSTGWFTNSAGKQVHTLGATRNANPDLKWEHTSMTNIGIDFGFFGNRLTGTVEYYYKDTKDLIADYAVPTTKYLYGWLTTNVGEITNKGVEFSVNAIPIQTKDFSWTTGLNISHNKNNVKKISNNEFSVAYMDEADLSAPGQSGNYQQRIMEGCPIGQFYTWEWAGYNSDGVSTFYVHDAKTGERTGETTVKPGYNDRAKTGSAQPKVTFGWNNNLNYKKWSMNLFFQGIAGNKILNGTRARLLNVIGNAGNRNLLKDASKTEKVTDYNSHMLSDRYLEKGDYLRLATLSLSYNIGNIGDWINNVRIYATCNNVFTITGYKGIDPEVYLGGLTPGIDNRQTYPRTRTYMLGVNINF